MSVSTVAIIGAGASGLVSANEAKQCGLIPTVFEEKNSIGGVWAPNSGKTWDNMKINNSYHGCSFSCFPWTEKHEDFPNRAKVYEYLCSYAKKFNLDSLIKLDCRVTKIEKFNTKWKVEWLSKQELQESKIFDSVVICSGFFSRAFIPKIPGLETFKGTIIHAQDYKNPDPFNGKTVAVIGNSFSGTEIASDLALGNPKKVIHIFKKAYWISSRYLKEKNSEKLIPHDLFFNRAMQSRMASEPFLVRNKNLNEELSILCKKQKEICPDFAIPDISTNPPFVAVSDNYLSQIKDKKIILKKGPIEKIEETTLFLSQERIDQIDCLVFCTGYRTDLPFFNEEMKMKLDFQSDDPLQPLLLYKNVFHPHLPNMAFIGLIRIGIYFGVAELQARLAFNTLSGKLPWPTAEELLIEIEKEKTIREGLPKTQFSRSYIGYCNELARLIDVSPDFEQLKKQNSILYDKLWNGPFTTSSFRLHGFGNNPDLAIKKIDELYTHVGPSTKSSECIYPGLEDTVD